LRGRGWTLTLGNDRCGVAAAVEKVLSENLEPALDR